MTSWICDANILTLSFDLAAQDELLWQSDLIQALRVASISISIRATCYQELPTFAQLLMYRPVAQKLYATSQPAQTAFCIAMSACESCHCTLLSTIRSRVQGLGLDEAKPMLYRACSPQVYLRADAPLDLDSRKVIRTMDVENLLSDLEKPLGDPYFQYHLLPFGYRHEIELFCTAKGSAYAVLTLSRKDSSGRFDERLMPLLDALTPHIAEGIARATVREALASPHGTDIGMMILDESGNVELANGVAETWLSVDSRKHWPLGLPLFAAMAARRTLGAERLIDVPFIDLPHPETGALYRLHREERIGPD